MPLADSHSEDKADSEDTADSEDNADSSTELPSGESCANVPKYVKERPLNLVMLRNKRKAMSLSN